MINAFIEDFNKVFKPQQEEILELLRNQPAHIEAAAAKIINEIKTVIHDCPCNKEILEALSQKTSKDKQIITIDDNISKSISGLKKYSYPNFSVGNIELGTGKNPGSLTWSLESNLEKLP